jgi:hypothetical protein
LASIDGNPTAANLGKLAVDEAAAHPGGLQHLDDYYVPTVPGSKKALNAAGSSQVDKKIPVRAIESAVYPLIGGFSEVPESGQSTTEAFADHLRAAGLSGKVTLFVNIKLAKGQKHEVDTFFHLAGCSYSQRRAWAK